MSGRKRQKRHTSFRDTYAKTVYIYTNGEGEKVYFDSIPMKRKTYYNQRGTQTKCIVHPRDPLTLVRKSISAFERRSNKEILVSEKYIVFDKDDFPNCLEAIKLAKDNDFTPILSNPSFEVWIGYHFRKTLPSNLTSSSILQIVSEDMQATLGKTYEKKDENLFLDLSPYLKDAISRSKVQSRCKKGQHPINKNPYTNIHEIIENLIHE
jgi:hypothetical protein